MDAAEPGAESDGAAAAPSSRRSPCGSCGAPSRYTCPGCGACSCSAACVAAHKAAAGCAGKRRRAAFVPLKAFDDATLRSDLRLLEETQLAAERARRARTGNAQLAQGLPRAALALQKARQTNKRCLTGGCYGVSRALAFSLPQAARERGTELLFQAPGMARREGNTSGIRHKSKARLRRAALSPRADDSRSARPAAQTIVWHVEWVFAGAAVRAQGRLAEDVPLRCAAPAQLHRGCAQRLRRDAPSEWGWRRSSAPQRRAARLRGTRCGTSSPLQTL